MKDKAFWIPFLLFGAIFIAYLAFPGPQFPAQLPDSYQSAEPADVETSLRRGFYTDMTRADVMAWFEKQFKWGIVINYPPEDAQTVIRDQTKSTFLEEIVHPFRESIYVNGFEPKEPQYAQIADGRKWRQKVIVRIVPSSPWVRIGIGVATLGLIYLIYLELKRR